MSPPGAPGEEGHALEHLVRHDVQHAGAGRGVGAHDDIESTT